MMMTKKAGLGLALAALAFTSPAIAGHQAGPFGGYAPQQIDPLLQQAEFVFTELEWATADIPGGSESGAGTYTLEWVGPFGDEYVDDYFRAGTAVIALMGEGPDIDLHVYDAHDNLLCSSTSYGAEELCEVQLAWPQPLVIRVDNQNQYSGSRFQLWTN